ncbi:MAG: LptA/OstA family protein [Pseudomonadota bacterium]
MRALVVSGLFVWAAMAASAQTGLTLQGAERDETLPVEVTADSLTVDQETQIAVFAGSARAVQGDITLEADVLRVTFDETAGDITQVAGDGAVRFENGSEIAEADAASYDILGERLVLEGNVTLIQSQTVITANRMVLNTETNDAELTGNVRTRFVPRN